MSRFIKINEQDSVIVLYEDVAAGTNILLDGQELTVQQDVSAGHKIAVRPLSAGEHVFKFGYSIGIASQAIEAGEWVHTHNVKSGLHGKLDYTYAPVASMQHPPASPQQELTFNGYVRANGDVGIRNEIWIINTVGCINKTCEALARMGNEQFRGRGIDGVYHFSHPYGCSQLGDDLQYTQKLLASLVHHPNAAGVLIVGLGCENNQISLFKEVIGDVDPNRVKFMGAQEVGDEIEEGLELISQLVDYAEQMKRQAVPVSKLKVGLKCGGSDGFSGITANPLLGAFSDWLTQQGGSTILTEVPEMFGAETILMNRAVNQTVFEDTVHLINDFKEYFISHGQEVYENPSPGNKAGGISTLEEKSLGCTQKAGHAAVVNVLPYGGRVSQPGLNLLQAPGNDLVSVTALSGSGAHIVLFTTGRGTPFGGPVPTVKVATNSVLAGRKKNWIDFNAGELIEGKPMEELSQEFIQYLLQVASGEQTTNNEKFGFREIAIFKDGVTL
ncbi:MAG: uxaA [Bacilli bacterium]|nr:uxaA [Bacilli bacterium]